MQRCSRAWTKCGNTSESEKERPMKRLALLAILALPLAARADFTGKMIKIGVLNDQSGLYKDLAGPGSVMAAKMAAEEFGNKIGDTPIEIVFADHQNKPDVGSGIARQWYHLDRVDVTVHLPTPPP